jgi:PHD/YefM family antitoxin component YafN of YafNO toxin-antitoxin module
MNVERSVPFSAVPNPLLDTWSWTERKKAPGLFGDLILDFTRIKMVHLCTQRYARRLTMETQKIGIREFRDKLSTYLLESDTPVAITRHGDTVGYYIPARRRRSETDRAALKEATSRWQEVLATEGISEDEAVEDFKKWRLNKKK